MDHFTLHVILLTEDTEQERIFSECPPVESVSIEFQTIPGRSADIDINAGKDFLIWTDEFDRIRPYLDIQRPDICLVCTDDSTEIIEEYEAASKELPELLFLWPTAEAPALQLHRFRQLIRHIAKSFQAWLNENYLMVTIDCLPDLVWYKSKDGLHWLVNKRFEETVHKTREQIHGKGHNYIWDVPPEDGGKSEFRCLESEREVMAKACTCISDEHVVTSEGMRHFLTYKTPLYDRLGEIMGTVGVGHDVTELNNFSLEIQMMPENLPFSIAMCDANYHMIQVNSQFQKEFSFSDQDARGYDYSDWKARTFSQIGERIMHEDSHYSTQELALEAPDGTQFFSLMEQEILDYYGNITGYCCVFENVTLEHEYKEMILTHANTDFLTKLYNRRYFFDYIKEQPDIQLTVLFMDMDHFKRANDTFGHAAGDTVLCKTADIIRESFPEALVARIGGDEYAAAIMGSTDTETIRERCEILQKKVEDTFAYMGLGISISIGVASTEKRPEDIDAFLNQSDQEMYLRKQAKKLAETSQIENSGEFPHPNHFRSNS